MIHLITADFCNALKAHHFRYLSIGMQIVKAVLPLRQRREQPLMRETAGAFKIFPVTCHSICIGNDFVHTAMFVAKHLFHLLIGKFRCDIDSPVAELQEEFLRLFIAAIYPCVAQSGIHFMQIVKRCPRAVIYVEVAFLETTPDLGAVGHTAHIADTPFGMVFLIRLCTLGNFTDHILHAAATFLITRGGIDRHRGEIVTTHVSVQAIPVWIGLGFRFQTSLFSEGCQQTVAIVLQESLDVKVTGMLQWAVEQRYVTQWELVFV